MGSTGKGQRENPKGADFFLVKFWTHMLENPECKHVCEWAADGRHIVIYDSDLLMAEIKSRGVCKQKDYSSFARQLRIYRWGRVKTNENGQSPWPSDAKVWRHPRLNRSSSLVDVANVTRNAPPKPNKAELAAGLPDSKPSKPRKRAVEVYVGEDGEEGTSKQNSEDSEDELQSSGAEQSLSTTLPRYEDSGNGNIAILDPVLSLPTSTLSQAIPSVSNPTPKETSSTGPSDGRTPIASTSTQQISRPLAAAPQSSNAVKAPVKTAVKPPKKYTKAVKAQAPTTVQATPPVAFDVETSIFDPNNNFGVPTARPPYSLGKGLHRQRNAGRDDSSDSSDDESINGNSIAIQNALSVPAMSIPQLEEAFLRHVVYDNAAIEHAAKNPANYDRLPWSTPSTGTQSSIAVAPVGNSTLASLESRLQSISASLQAADEAAARHVTVQ